MAGISNKKVSRVARTGGSSRRKGERPIAFYASLVVIVVIGSLIVGFSRNERLAETTPNNTPPLEPVVDQNNPDNSREGDRWYEAYGVYLCDAFAPNIDNTDDLFGMSTQNDGIMYIHPYEKQYAGQNATVGLFFDSVDVELTDNSITIGDTTYTDNETKCGDQTGRLVATEWTDPSNADGGTVINHSPRDVRVKDGAAITIAFVPEGTDVPLPESVPELANAESKDTAGAAATDTSVVEGTETTDTTVAGDTTETPAAPTTDTQAPAAGGQ